MLLRQLFDRETCTYTYLLADTVSKEALLIDPVRENFQRDRQLIEQLGLKLRYTAETHVHADHVTSAGLFREHCGSQSAVAKSGGTQCAERQLEDGERLHFGTRYLEVRTTPGHTDGCTTFVLDDHSMAFTGDTLFIRGCGRTDFQAGDPRKLYRSIHEKIFSLPDDTLIYPGHDYKGSTVSTVGEEKRFNPRLGGGKTEEEFSEIMNALKLDYPKRILESVPANLACGTTQSTPFDAKEGESVAEVDVEWVFERSLGARIVDVRGESEFDGELGHIEGAENVPLDRLSEEARDWDKHWPVVLVCHAGRRSLSGVRALEELGIHKVASMRGGMVAWKNADLPCTR